MYHPYFRGKQFELITIRETARLLKQSKFVPIVEPVKQSVVALQKTIDAVLDNEGYAIVIVNPFHGELSQDGHEISTLLADRCQHSPNISAGVLLKENTTIAEVASCCEAHKDHPITLIHAGFSDGRGLATMLGERVSAMQQVFFDGRTSKLYQKHFRAKSRVLIRDGFERRRGKDHPDCEFFSDLHATFNEENMTGFGDFLTVGDDYIESGGPAYTVTIHITFIDHEKDDEMHIHHFKSDRQDTPTDPAGKFAEALTKLIQVLDSPTNKIFDSTAIREFRELQQRGHFPGLGYVKKLSMNHHIETLANYFSPLR